MVKKTPAIVRTTAAPFKVSVKVDPVAWSRGKVTKYRASVVVRDNKKQSRQVGGDPAETKAKAVENLRRELATFAASIQKGVQYTNAVIDYMYINGSKEVPTDSELEDYIKACEKAKEKEDRRYRRPRGLRTRYGAWSPSMSSTTRREKGSTGASSSTSPMSPRHYGAGW